MKASKVLKLIQARTGAPVHQAELATAAGCCTRTVRRATEKMRRAGVPILSSCSPTTGGYWMAGDAASVEAWRQHFIKAGKSILKTAAALRADSGQLPLFDLEEDDDDNE